MSGAGLSNLGKTLGIALATVGPDGAAARLAPIWIALLLAGCGAVAGDARLGPNPGGGFYGAPNLNVGRVNP
jgi:hypothetical protein